MKDEIRNKAQKAHAAVVIDEDTKKLPYPTRQGRGPEQLYQKVGCSLICYSATVFLSAKPRQIYNECQQLTDATMDYNRRAGRYDSRPKYRYSFSIIAYSCYMATVLYSAIW
jgi:hypothetical protein